MVWRHTMVSPRSFIRQLKIALGAALILGLLAANLHVASAHRWWQWHWHRGGNQVVIKSYIYGTTTTQAEAARQDAWNKIGILYNYRVNYHTDVSVFDGYYDTNWGGLASIEEASWDWGCWDYCHIEHAHARYNTKYPTSSGYIQGIYCQEVFHAYGFDHSNTGDCMGLGYYNWDKFVLSSHNVNDFYNLYHSH